jgi:hypothetical protein
MDVRAWFRHRTSIVTGQREAIGGLRNHPWEKRMPKSKSAMNPADTAQSTSKATFAALVHSRDVQMPTMHIGGTRNAQPPSAMYWPRLNGPRQVVDAQRAPQSSRRLGLTRLSVPKRAEA